jgi:hypothetical protein
MEWLLTNHLLGSRERDTRLLNSGILKLSHGNNVRLPIFHRSRLYLTFKSVQTLLCGQFPRIPKAVNPLPLQGLRFFLCGVY